MIGETERVMTDAIELIQDACITKRVMMMSNCFVGGPHCFGAVVCYAVCPDDIARELRTMLDATVQEFLKGRCSGLDLPRSPIN
jgi:hypothetical protein